MKTTISMMIILIAFTAIGQSNQTFFKSADQFFKSYVEDGRVDYNKIKSNPEELKSLLNQIATIKIDKSNSKEYQAFYINAYNLSVIDGIIKNYPVNSPLDVKGFFDKNTYLISGKEITLNDIENKVLRKQFPDEPRFHFVLVCAGLGCPPIINEAYTPLKLEDQLERQTKKAINDPYFIRVKGNKVQLSQIFEWYNEDFVKNGSEVDFVNLYRTEKIDGKAKVSYYAYDWKLNDKKK